MAKNEKHNLFCDLDFKTKVRRKHAPRPTFRLAEFRISHLASEISLSNILMTKSDIISRSLGVLFGHI